MCHRLLSIVALVLALSSKNAEAVKARWITIKNPSNYLQLSQVAVYAKNGNIVSLAEDGATCTASPGLWWNDPRQWSQCEWAIDGVMTSRGDPDYYYHSSSSSNGWWKLDLGRNIDIDRVDIYNRARDWDDCCTHRLATANIKIQWRKALKIFGVVYGYQTVTSYTAGLNDSLAQTHFMPDSVTNTPITVIPPTPTCNDLTGDPKTWCQNINKYVCNNLPHLSDPKRICKMLTPRLLAASYNQLKAMWEAVKDNAVTLWQKFKAGNLSHFDVFRFVDKVMADFDANLGDGSSSDLGEILGNLDLHAAAVQQALFDAGHAITWTTRKTSLLFDALAQFVMGLGGGLNGSYSGMRSQEECKRCSEMFEMISELVDLNDPCQQTFTAATYAAVSSYWTMQGYVTSGYDVTEYTRCSVYKSFYCTQDISCYDWSDYQ